MSDIRTFRAASMKEALDRVRMELGSDAVILHTKHTTRRRILPWRKPQQQIEITAGVGVNVGKRSPSRKSTASPAKTRTAEPALDSSQDSLAARLAKQVDDTVTLSSNASSESAQRDDDSRSGNVTNRMVPPATREGATFPSTSPSRFAFPTSSASSPSAISSARFSQQSAEPVSNGLQQDVSEKLDAIHRMLESLGKADRGRGADELPGELFELYTELIDAEVEEDLARDLVFRLRKNAPEATSDPAAARAALTGIVEAEISCAEPIRPVRGRRKVVALVGPTGVGKTTTIAKLAANFRLVDDVRMGLITVDTYRVAAVEQLRTYAEIIDLPMKVVTSAPEMRRALDELSGLDLILIDTAGRSPRDQLQINELRSLLQEAEVDEVHLVLSLTASMKSLRATAEKFLPVGTSSLILTKLDEAAGLGTTLSLCRSLELPVSYLTTGQDVPDDIEPANATRLARLVLGREAITA